MNSIGTTDRGDKPRAVSTPDGDSRFAFSTTVDVRWRDLDALAHVNNAVYFTYLEHARVEYLRGLGLVPDDPNGIGIIMAEASCRYTSPLRLAERVTVHIRVSGIRNSSFTFEYLVSGGDGRLAATAHTVQVCYDYQALGPVRMPQEWRDTIIAYEPALGVGRSDSREEETTL
jgi:acyl-CoA thioester hydrolase